tara:strand:+ start:152 stop:262 length:111 start_codon:yes stop_codon:yes gene_type:complete
VLELNGAEICALTICFSAVVGIAAFFGGILFARLDK